MAEFKLFKIYDHDCFYNIDTFLKFVNGLDKQWRDRIDAFTSALDRHITIDKDDQNIAPIYEGMDKIIERITHVLKTKKTRIYSDMEIIPTGSKTLSGKVGSPLEADFLIKRSSKIDCKTYKRKPEYSFSKQLANNIVYVLSQEDIHKDARLRIDGMHEHEDIQGVGVIISFVENYYLRVGVTMDIVLFRQYQPNNDTEVPQHNVDLFNKILALKVKLNDGTSVFIETLIPLRIE